MGQSLLYANALDVVKSTQMHPKAGEILNRHLTMGRKEIDGLNCEISSQMYGSDGNTTTGYISGSATETEKLDQVSITVGYDSDGHPVVRNSYVAAGSSAYMSDADVSNIKAPLITAEVGRKREKRYKPMFERSRKGRKRYTGTPIIHEAYDSGGELGNSMIPIPDKGVPKKQKTSKKKSNKK